MIYTQHRTVLTTVPYSPLYHFSLGNSHLELQEYDKAQEHHQIDYEIASQK